MITDLGEQPKPTQEGESKERIIELNEWFTPFENYHDLPYAKKTDKEEEKAVSFRIAHLGKFDIGLSWPGWGEVDPPEETDIPDDDDFLLVLPASEKFIRAHEVKKEEEKLETKLFRFDGPDSFWEDYDEAILQQQDKDKNLPYIVEIELPSGALIRGPLHDIYGMDHMLGIADEDGYEYGGRKIWHQFLVPETEHILNRIKMRFVKN